MVEFITYTCTTCAGTTQVEGLICPDCLGRGALPIIGQAFLWKTLFTVTAAMQATLDTIVAEQAAQRADLTAALTQIWNKVKDL